MIIKGYRVEQGENHFFVGAMKASDLLDRTQVDHFVSGHPDGYQRNLSEARARSFGRFMDSGGISPASILLNMRDADINEETEGFINIPDDIPIWVVDGQHRMGGIRFAVERDPSLNNLEFPIIIMNQKSSYEEAKQFVIINKTQKGVRTDLAERFLMRAVQEEGREKLFEMRETGALRTILKDVEWVTKAIEIADILNGDKKHPWYGKIQLPNSPKIGTTVSQKAFTDSLEPVLKDTFFLGRQVQQIASALGNYWDAIDELCSDAIVNPKEHVIQKTTGVSVLNKIFPRVTEICRDDKGNRVLTRDKFKIVLQGMPFMDSEYWESNGMAGRRGTSKKAFSSLSLEALEALETSPEATETDIII